MVSLVMYLNYERGIVGHSIVIGTDYTMCNCRTAIHSFTEIHSLSKLMVLCVSFSLLADLPQG